MDITSPIFKGATRPACLFGVPIKPFIGVTLGCFIAGMWTWIPAAFACVPLVALMREATREDDQKFRAIAIRLRLLGLRSGIVRFAPTARRRVP